MPEQSESADAFEVYCMLCNKPLTEDDEIHITLGPFGYDFDVLCNVCMEQTKRGPADVPDIGQGFGSGLDLGLDSLDLFDVGREGKGPLEA